MNAKQDKEGNMPSFEDLDIPITKLILDLANPRHPKQDSQTEILKWMTQGTGTIGDHLANLAKDIVVYGLNPAERSMVSADPNKPDEYIVLEGNRRVAAVKLLNNPESAPSSDWSKRFIKIRGSAYMPIKSIRCTAFESPEDAYHFIELRHMGQSEGVGIVTWGAEPKARHALRVLQKSRHHKALALLDYLKTTSKEKDIRQYATSGFPITTLDRLLSDSDFRDFLGLRLDENGELAFRIEPAEAIKPINRVIRDFGSGEKNVRDVINKEAREKYQESVPPKDRADHTANLQKHLLLKEEAATTEDKSGGQQPSRSKYVDPRRRRTVVIPGTVISIDSKKHNRPRRVFEELRGIQLRNKQGKPAYPNAAVLLLRLFLEMSVDTYIREKKLTHPAPQGWKDVKLIERLRVVLKDLDKIGRMEETTVKVINKVLGDPSKKTNPNSLNDYAHNLDQVVDATDIVDIWDTYKKFLEALWDALK